MKRILSLLAGLLFLPPTLRAEGPLTPPGAPAPTMKTLQEIWDRMGELQAQMNLLADLQGAGFVEMISVGNPGNTADTTGAPNPAGAVAYDYKVGKYEVTNAQYTGFLNAVAAADTTGLFHGAMAGDPLGGISFSGSFPNFTFAVKANMGNKPVNFVSWYDALRFCNWLHNGRPTGAQGLAAIEDGAYTLTGPTSVAVGTHPTHGANGRNAGARYHLPSENEWYKAAYHEPGASGNSYWLYPTRSDGPGTPTVATADATGNINNDTANIANYNSGADWNGQNGNVTTVGSGGTGSQSFYGSFDMAGNLWEWNEEDIGGKRGLRGGSFNFTSNSMQATERYLGGTPTSSASSFGFRVASP